MLDQCLSPGVCAGGAENDLRKLGPAPRLPETVQPAGQLAGVAGTHRGKERFSEPAARLACVNVLRTSLLGLDPVVDKLGRNPHLQRLVELKHWARSLPVATERITYHVFESSDPASALVDYARHNHIDHIIIGARGSSPLRRLLGSVSAKVVTEAPCTVTVVRVRDVPVPPEFS